MAQAGTRLRGAEKSPPDWMQASYPRLQHWLTRLKIEIGPETGKFFSAMLGFWILSLDLSLSGESMDPLHESHLELRKYRFLGLAADQLKQKLWSSEFAKLSRWFFCTLKFGNYSCRPRRCVALIKLGSKWSDWLS